MDKSLPPSPYMDKPLPELKGVVSWKTLAEVTPVKQKDRFVPQFSKGISALDKKEVKLQGFMMPLDMGEKQKRFLLVALPPSCAFCLPGGPDQMVEVVAKTPVKYGFDPIVITRQVRRAEGRPDGALLPPDRRGRAVRRPFAGCGADRPMKRILLQVPAALPAARRAAQRAHPLGLAPSRPSSRARAARPRRRGPRPRGRRAFVPVAAVRPPCRPRHAARGRLRRAACRRRNRTSRNRLANYAAVWRVAQPAITPPSRAPPVLL